MARSEGAAAQEGPPAVDGLTYTEASRELDEIVAFFEQREVDVDQLVSRLERATAIVDELDRRLRRTRTQVEELVPRLEAAAAGRRGDTASDAEDEDEDEDGEPIAAEEETTMEEELGRADRLAEQLGRATGAGPGRPGQGDDAPGLF